MSTIKEVREFFLRSIPVTAGSKKDREQNFPLTHIVKGVTKFNRFLKGHVPSAEVMSKFLHSVPFILNNESTAQTGQQGLVKLATDQQVSDRSNSDSDGMALAVTPQQIPEIKPDDTVGIKPDYLLEVVEELQNIAANGTTGGDPSESDLGQRKVIKVGLSAAVRALLDNITPVPAPVVTSASSYVVTSATTVLILVGTSPKSVVLPNTPSNGDKVIVKALYSSTFEAFDSIGDITVTADEPIDRSVSGFVIANKDATTAYFHSVLFQYIEETEGSGEWFVISDYIDSVVHTGV